VYYAVVTLVGRKGSEYGKCPLVVYTSSDMCGEDFIIGMAKRSPPVFVVPQESVTEVHTPYSFAMKVHDNGVVAFVDEDTFWSVFNSFDQVFTVIVHYVINEDDLPSDVSSGIKSLFKRRVVSYRLSGTSVPVLLHVLSSFGISNFEAVLVGNVLIALSKDKGSAYVLYFADKYPDPSIPRSPEMLVPYVYRVAKHSR